MTKVEKLKKFIEENLSKFVSSGSYGMEPRLPDFELYAYDYLRFANNELENFISSNEDARLINCISYLKRALDCQLDTFLYCFNLYKIFSSRNLKFEKKMDFLKASGIFDSRTLVKLNTIRNRMEHSYRIPKVQDIEVYYDLVSAFIAVLERTILFMLTSYLEFGIGGFPEDTGSIFSIEYDFKLSAIKVSWHLNQAKEKLIVDITNIVEFTCFFKVFILLHQRDAFASDDYILSQVQKLTT